ncbi:MAG: putative inorganic carbon transporter subunit DabA, partial [Bacteroidota bacterium]
IDTREKRKKDFHLAKYTHSLFQGWFITQTLGFWSILRLFLQVFKPSSTPAAASSFKQMDKFSKLSIENFNEKYRENNLQIGFTVTEMTDRVEALLKSIGLVDHFAPLIYVVGHGSSSVNNTHYSAYDCGACSGRPGSVNARVLSFMANHNQVRAMLNERGLHLPESTQFVGGLHDTTRDEIAFFDEDQLSEKNQNLHKKNLNTFHQALDLNAKERSRRLASIDTGLSPKKIHQQILTRSVSLFEPRPELNHATNAMCIVGSRELSKDLFLDRRSFLNSYNYKIDPNGDILVNIMKPLGPVCGGINLEYYFSRVDNHKLGAGSKLPHNVMGLIGVANGVDGDLRPGLPSQMIEVHDPLRLMIVVEHFPEIVLKTVQSVDSMYEWFKNEWVHLVAIHPENHNIYYFKDGRFSIYEPITASIPSTAKIASIIESTDDNISVQILEHKA